MNPSSGPTESPNKSATPRPPAHGVVALIALGFFVAYWHRLFLQNLIPFDGNTLRLFYPSWSIGNYLFKEGAWLWDPFRNMGQPFLANPQNEALYPLRFLSPFISFLTYEKLFVVFHSCLTAGFTFQLIRRETEGPWPAALAAVGAAFNGFFLSRIPDHSDVAAMAWTPAALYFLAVKNAPGLGAVLALQWLAGFPPFTILTIFLLIVSAAAAERPKFSFRTLGLGTIYGAGLSAVQAVPFLEMFRESYRPLSIGSDIATQYSMHPWELLRPFIVPAPLLEKLPPVSTSDSAVIGFYIGPFVTALAALGIWKGGRREKILGAAALAFFLLSLGRYLGFYHLIPFISVFRFPAHWLMPAIFLTIVLAAAGAAALPRDAWKRGALALVAADLFLFSVPAHAVWAELSFFTATPQRIQGLQEVPNGTRVFHTESLMRSVPRWPMKSIEDWAFLKATLAPSFAAAHGLREATGHFQLESARNLNYRMRLNASPFGSALFDYAGISRVVGVTREGAQKEKPSWDEVGAFINPHPLPRAFIAPRGEVAAFREKPGRLDALAEGPGLLVYSESYYPGWRARVNGKKAPVEIFEGKFVAVKLPAGPCEATIEYRPASFVIGLMISSLTAGFLIARFVQRRRRMIPLRVV